MASIIFKVNDKYKYKYKYKLQVYFCLVLADFYLWETQVLATGS